jgi:hypothetical protein
VTEDNLDIQSIKIAEVRAIKTSRNTYFTVHVDKSREFLFKVAIMGKVSLLEYPRISINHYGGLNSGHYEWGEKEISYYAIKSPDKTVVIKWKKDLNEFLNLIENCPEAKAVFEQKFFNMDKLAIIVNRLNDCK